LFGHPSSLEEPVPTGSMTMHARQQLEKRGSRNLLPEKSSSSSTLEQRIVIRKAEAKKRRDKRIST
jgi:hypothetical protein